jgi:hypothetical protein
MSRHRKRPAPRHQAQAYDGQPAAERSGRRFGAALRRVIVSPTFAAGLGIVIAAMLVLPMTGTIFHYTLPPGRESTACPEDICPSPGGGGHAAIKGGKRIAAGNGPEQRAGAAAQATPPAGDPAPSPSGLESLRYQTVKQWPGGFMGQITITLAPGSGDDWQLWFGYPAADIQAVSGGGAWISHGDHRAQVTAGPSAGVPAGQPIDVTFEVTGEPSAPAYCTFNGQDCHLEG